MNAIIEWRFVKSLDQWLLVCPEGLGDTYFTCGFAEEIRKKHGGKSISVLVKPSHKFIPMMFPGIKNIYTFPKWYNPHFARHYTDFKPGKIFYAHIQEASTKLIGVNGITLLDTYRALFRLPPNTQLSTPKKISKEARLRGEKFLINHGLIPGKTVILAPGARSCPKFNKTIWDQISLACKESGYSVALNTTNGMIVANTTPLSIPIECIQGVASASGWVISTRSGLCDILSTAHCRLTILYPKIQWQSGSMLESTSIRSMGLSRTTEEFEMDLFETDARPFLSSIIL